jgi:hypothetical protein
MREPKFVESWKSSSFLEFEVSVVEEFVLKIKRHGNHVYISRTPATT